MIRPNEYPVVGSWYWDIDHASQFEVVAQDEAQGTVEIQYFSGEIEDLDIDTWFAMHVVSIAPPKDWSGPFELDNSQFPDELENGALKIDYWSDPLAPFEDEK